MLPQTESALTDILYAAIAAMQHDQGMEAGEMQHQQALEQQAIGHQQGLEAAEQGHGQALEQQAQAAALQPEPSEGAQA